MKRLLVLMLLFALIGAPVDVVEAAEPGTEVVLEDFSDVVTEGDLGFNDFSGNSGSLNKDGRPYGDTSLRVPANGRPVLRFEWDFGIDADQTAFTGLFHSLFGLTMTRVTFDAGPPHDVLFREHSLNLDRIDGIVAEPGGPRRVDAIHFDLTYGGATPLTLRLELKDADDPVGLRFERFVVPGSASPQSIAWRFRTDFRLNQGFDLERAKELAVVVEREHVGDGVENPESGVLEIERIWLELDRPEAPPPTDEVLLDLIERRSCQYFVDWSSRKPESFGMPMDRSTFADLLTVGGVGFALPAMAICAERGWITRAQALERVLPVLRLLTDRKHFGPGPIGPLGYRGWLYHFLGPDGRRKQNFDFVETPRDERLNTVELSTIDTGLAVLGALAAQSYFDRADPAEAEVRRLAQELYDAVDWPFMLEPLANQFYLGWKPNEQREPEPAFEIPDALGAGKYSGIPTDPATLDFYTDEALIVILLAVGSTTNPVPPSVYCALTPSRDPQGLVRTYPGALFTYEFAHAFLDTRTLGLRGCGPEPPVDWYENSQRAIRTVIEYATTNPDDLPTYGPDAWGISAAEGPDDRYRAYGASPVAVNPLPEQDGTVTYYAEGSALGFDGVRAGAIRALRAAWDRGHWHPRFGLPDAFHDAIDDADLDPEKPLLRTAGPWLQRARFAIDEGPMLLHLENSSSRLIWELLAANPNIERALDRLRPTPVPALTGTDPASPANHNAPRVRGSAAPSSTVSLYTDPSCSGPVAATGSAAEFASPGLPVSVPDDSVTTFRATAVRDPGSGSACSASAITYVEDSTAPETTIVSGPPAWTAGRTPTFTFGSSEPRSKFRCGEQLAACSSPHTIGPLRYGRHQLTVRAVDAAGNHDATPAAWPFTVVPACRGQLANMVPASRLIGTASHDVMVGTAGDDRIDARGGDDLICAGAGDDRVSGGAGGDRVRGQDGGDRMSGDGGDDRLLGGDGGDRIAGGRGGDGLDGGRGRDRCRGGPGSDTVRRCERR